MILSATRILEQHGSWNNMDTGGNAELTNTLSANYKGQLAKNVENKKFGTWMNVFQQVISASGRLNRQVTRKCPLSINITGGESPKCPKPSKSQPSCPSKCIHAWTLIQVHHQAAINPHLAQGFHAQDLPIISRRPVIRP